MGRHTLAITAAAAAVLLLLARSARGSTSPVEGLPDGVEWDDYTPAEPWSFPDLTNHATDPSEDAMDAVDAFEYMIRSSEHSVRDELRYTTFYGGSQFTDLSDHPVNTGEKKGIPLPPDMCRAAGFASGNCVSTAAGAYQITRPTWGEFRQAGSWGPYLPDFSPASQDEAARRILLRIGALPLIEAGEIEQAIYLASKRWASLPGSTARQGGRSLEFALARFNDYLSGMA